MNFVALPHTLAGVFAAMFGLAFGSFVGMYAYRLPRNESIVRKRSFCPGCGIRIPAWRNIPLVSYALQKGRCIACKGPIHWRYPVSEALCGLLAWACWRKFGMDWSLAAGTALCCVLVLLSVIDMERRLLPDRLTLPLLWLGLLFSLTRPETPFVPPPQAIMGAVAGYGLLALTDFLWRLLRKRPAFGGGDLKLLAALGAWFGPYGAFGVFGAAAVTGALYATLRALSKRTVPREELPFGPFLMLAGVWNLLGPNTLDPWRTGFPLAQALSL